MALYTQMASSFFLLSTCVKEGFTTRASYLQEDILISGHTTPPESKDTKEQQEKLKIVPAITLRPV